jgi:hypothetical protein
MCSESLRIKPRNSLTLSGVFLFFVFFRISGVSMTVQITGARDDYGSYFLIEKMGSGRGRERDIEEGPHTNV